MGCLGGDKHTNTQTHEHTNTQTHKHTNIQTHKHTNIQSYKHTNIQTYKRTNIQTYKHSNTQTHKRTNTQTCTHINKQTYTYTFTIRQSHYICVSFMQALCATNIASQSICFEVQHEYIVRRANCQYVCMNVCVYTSTIYIILYLRNSFFCKRVPSDVAG